jgi:hypothetical protein
VELCLAFEAYSPAHLKNSLWPTNLAAAVAELQSPAQTSRETPPTANESPRLQQARTADDSSQPTAQPFPSSSSTQSAAIAPLQGPYPHLSYGHPKTQPLPAYPHTPYYTPFSHPHSFPPNPSAPYAHTAYPPSQGQTSFPPFTGVPLARHPHTVGAPSADHGGIPADDLPSYEDMLVEALTDLNEPDGSAPKSLFTWMASRYPLHSNFRPSASQALQKAFKRGRLEKGSNGKYRLNASWDGGSVRSMVQGLTGAVADIHSNTRQPNARHGDRKPLDSQRFRHLMAPRPPHLSHTPRLPTLHEMGYPIIHRRPFRIQHKANPHTTPPTPINTHLVGHIQGMCCQSHLRYRKAKRPMSRR